MRLWLPEAHHRGISKLFLQLLRPLLPFYQPNCFLGGKKISLNGFLLKWQAKPQFTSVPLLGSPLDKIHMLDIRIQAENTPTLSHLTLLSVSNPPPSGDKHKMSKINTCHRLVNLKTDYQEQVLPANINRSVLFIETCHPDCLQSYYVYTIRYRVQH